MPASCHILFYLYNSHHVIWRYKGYWKLSLNSELIVLIDVNKMNIYINVTWTSIEHGDGSVYAVSVNRWCLCTSRVLIIIINRAQHAMRGDWLDAWQPGYPCSTAVELVTCRMPTTMKWWTVLVVVVVVCAGAVEAGAQETGPHLGSTAADRGYVAGE
jgi:hypothetical protein